MQQEASSSPRSLPQLVVVMGVSGCGKSTLARTLARRRRWLYLDGDDYHSDEALSRMASGEPLSDAMRAPWVARICAHLAQLAGERQGTVLAFSGLRREHRDQLRHTGFAVQFVFLDGDRELIRQRMAERAGHFMPPELLDSQYASLESPLAEPDVRPLDIALPPEELAERADELTQQPVDR